VITSKNNREQKKRIFPESTRPKKKTPCTNMKNLKKKKKKKNTLRIRGESGAEARDGSPRGEIDYHLGNGMKSGKRNYECRGKGGHRRPVGVYGVG
jgi:hypothetical protein